MIAHHSTNITSVTLYDMTHISKNSNEQVIVVAQSCLNDIAQHITFPFVLSLPTEISHHSINNTSARHYDKIRISKSSNEQVIVVAQSCLNNIAQLTNTYDLENPQNCTDLFATANSSIDDDPNMGNITQSSLTQPHSPLLAYSKIAGCTAQYKFQRYSAQAAYTAVQNIVRVSNFYLTCMGKRVTDSFLLQYPHSDINIQVHFPLRGGQTSHTYTTLKVATWNLNGCFRNDNSVHSNSIWLYVQKYEIDILYLIDHRSDLRTLKIYKKEASAFLGIDVALTAAPVAHHNLKATHQSEWSASVGGVAIMAFGALATFLSPPLVIDPSGAGTYLGALLNTQDNHPPIILFPMYIFPTTTGRTTVHTRVSLYLDKKGISTSLHEWQTNSIHKGIFQLREKHLDAQVIAGGDINITHWDSHLPLVKLFASLKLENKAICLPQYNHITTYTSGDTTSWLDQLLITNKLDLVTAHAGMLEDDSKYSFIDISDHQPYFNEYKLHHTITSSHDPTLQSKLRKCGRTFDIKPDSHMVEKFQKHLADFTLKLVAPQDTIEEHERHYNIIMNGILNAAKSAHPRYFQHKLWQGWNPESQLLHNLHRALKLARRVLPHQPTQAATLLSSFYHKHYNATNRDGEYTFREIYDTLLINNTNTAYLTLINSTLTLDTVDAMLKHIKSLNHSSKRRQIRNKISIHCQQQEDAFDMGKIGRSIRSLLEKPGREQMIPPPDPRTNRPYTSQTTLHNDINTHFTTHFGNRSSWIQRTKLDTPETAHIRADILDGNWRNHESTLLHPLPSDLHSTACIFFDCMKRKASHEAQQELFSAYNTPVSLEEYTQVLNSEKGGKSPGPSGVTINHLKLLPPELTATLHNTLQFFFSKHHVPTQWQKRSMTFIAKQDEPTSFTHYRPIMLLEDTRKLWLTILKRRRDPIIHKYQLLNKSQYGGVNHSGTEDPILQITNCIEYSHERQTSLHIIFLDQQRAFDSPRRLSGINLAWQRLGIHPTHADYITRLDEDNMIYARTPQYLMHPSNTKHFKAAGGASQGDSDATNNFNVVYDISLDVHAKISSEVDYYHFAAADGTLIPQLPTTFIDDWSSTHRTIEGTQHGIFNIFGNTKKHLHMAFNFVLPQPSDTLYAYDDNGTC